MESKKGKRQGSELLADYQMEKTLVDNKHEKKEQTNTKHSRRFYR